MVEEHPSRQMPLERQRPEENALRDLAVAPLAKQLRERIRLARHQIDARLRRVEQVQAAGRLALDEHRELSLRIEHEPAGEAPARGAKRGLEDWKDNGSRLAGTRSPEDERVAGEHLARDVATWRVQASPLRDSQPEGAGGDLGRRRRRIADVVDEAQEMRNGGRDRELAVEQLGVEQCNRVRIAIANRALDEALEDTGEAGNTARPRLRGTGKETSKTLEHREVGIVDGAAARLRRIAAVERALDEAREVVHVEAGQARADRCAPVGGQRARFNDSEVVVEHLRARLRNPLVAEGKDDGRSALGDGHRTGAHPHAGVAPARQRIAVVPRARPTCLRASRCESQSVSRSTDANEHVDGVDKLLDRIDAELARDAHDGAVGVMDELHWGLLA